MQVYEVGLISDSFFKLSQKDSLKMASQIIDRYKNSNLQMTQATP